MLTRLLCALPACGCALLICGAHAPPPTQAEAPTPIPPPPPPAVDVTLPTGFQMRTFASEPLVSDPVAFDIDAKGRFYVAESERQERGIEDNRTSSWWLMDDLTAKTVADRLAYYEKWKDKRDGGMDYYRKYA
ncbi:MAG: hypothetical protein FJ256_08515, partial [Phycisphaerae bacterium]|nr:hypothetical protein [Phycisphaerae bacterium]